MNLSVSRLFGCAVLAVLCAGCGHRRFAVPTLTKARAQVMQEKAGIQVLACTLSCDELDRVMQRPHAFLGAVRCVVLTIVNNTSMTLTLDRSRVNAVLLTSKQVRHLLGESVGGDCAVAAAGYALVPFAVGGVAGLVCHSMVAFTAFTFCTFMVSIPLIIIDVVAFTDRQSYDLGCFIDSVVLTRKQILSGTTRSVLLFMDNPPASLRMDFIKHGGELVSFAVPLAQ